MVDFWLIVALAEISYFFGSFPTARVIAGKKARGWGKDSWGTMSTLQKTGSYFKAALVLAGDVLKGFLPVFFALFLARLWGYNELWALTLSAGGAVLGHNHSVFLRFQGGRGLATGFGALLALNWLIALACLVTLLYFILATELWMYRRFAGGFKKIIRDNLLGRIIGVVSCLAVIYGLTSFGQFCALLPMMVLIILSHQERVKIFVKENKEVLLKRLGVKNSCN